jgi:CDP-4-dehydro-6-deoxyglucose reductase
MSYQVRLAGGECFPADPQQSVLSAALHAGINLPSDCRQGVCGTCRIRLLEGRVAYDEPPMALMPEDEAAGFALACQAHAASDLVIRMESLALPPPARHAATIRRIERFTPDVIHLELALEASADYLPGQYMKVHLADGTTRNFSMASRPASSPEGGVVDFHVRRIAGGRFTDATLSRLKPGERLEVELPLGSFIFRRQDYRPVLMVVTGTGFAPIRSMLEALLDDPDCPPITLYRGMRCAADLYMDDELRGWHTRLADFRYVPVLSRGETAWSGRRGHVQDAVCADFDDLSEHAIYLCGSPNMIAQAKQAFRARGASMDYVYADGFSFQYQEALT